MNESREQFDAFEEELQRLEPVELSFDGQRRMIEGAGDADVTDGETTNEVGQVAPPSTFKLWTNRRWMAVAACLIMALLVGLLIPAFQPAQKFGSRDGGVESHIESAIGKSHEIGDWVIHPVSDAQFVIHEESYLELDSGEIRIESKSLAKPEASLRIETPLGEAELKDQGYYIVSHSPTESQVDSPSESSSKGSDMKSLTKILILTGAVTLTNAFGSIDGSSDTLLAAEKDKAPVAHAVKANSDFAFDLYKQLAKENEGENLFFSPYSITSALAMTTEGARGNTAKQMGDVLRFPKVALQNNKAQPWNTSVIHSGLGALNQRYNASGKPFELAVANAIWVEKTFPLRVQFEAALSKPYGVKMVNPVDFKGNAEGERQRINSWVEDKTKERIKDLLPDRSLNDRTRVVLTNAIYFKGDWAAKFEKRDTADRVFKMADGKQLKTPMMFRDERKFRFAMLKADGTPDTSRFGRSDKNGFAIIELPYKGKELSMIAIAPNSPKGLAGVEANLNQTNVDKWISRMHREEVNVLLPKFKMTIDYKLNGTLIAMGMKDAFTRHVADFTGISDSPEADRLYISLVQHKAFVEVNEEGTEASAATAVVIAIESARMVPAFNADRPFLYLIRDNKTGTILFLGRVMNPKG